MLFRTAVASMDKGVPPESSLFDGPSALEELVTGLVQSGLEPSAYVDHFLNVSGLNIKNGLAVELRWLVFGLHLMATQDRLNLPRITTSEHFARRILQIQKATRRNPKAPDFTGLEAYTAHLGGGAAPMRTPTFDKFVMEEQKSAAFLLKQARLLREERRSGGQPPGDASGRPEPKKKAKKKKKEGEGESSAE